jgi:hypothetical protein
MDNIDTSELLTLYPHVAAKIKTLWGTKECRTLLMTLLNDSRGGTRAGFPVSIGRVIILLLNEHDANFPRFDDTGEFIVPFTGVRSRPAIVRQQHDWGIIGSAAKLMAFVLLAAIFFEIYKKL